MLVASDYPLDLVTNKGQTAFFLAAAKGNTKICKTLLKFGADINRTDDQNISPLYMAILNHHTETAEYLIEQGAQYYNEEVEERDLSPIYLAIRHENT